MTRNLGACYTGCPSIIHLGGGVADMLASDRFTELKQRVEKAESEIKEAAAQDKPS
jgi:hypothetical protein